MLPNLARKICLHEEYIKDSDNLVLFGITIYSMGYVLSLHPAVYHRTVLCMALKPKKKGCSYISLLIL